MNKSDTPVDLGSSEKLGALLSKWAADAFVQFVSRSDGLRTTTTVSRDALLLLVERAVAAVGSELKDARALADSEGTRAVNYLRRSRKAEAALRELVALKDLKEGPMERSIRASMSIGANPSAQYHRWNEDYQRRKPLAWQAARDVFGPNGSVEPPRRDA